MNTPPLAIFDLDGTLIDSAPDILRAANLLLRDFDCAPLELADVREMIGDGATNLVERALAARQCTALDLNAALKQFMQHYAASPTAHTQLYPGVVATLQRLKERGITMTVCTNKPAALSGTILAQLDIARYFSAVLGGDSRPYRKPDPRMIQELLQKFGTSPRQAVLIGDSEIDAATAQAAGVPFILVTYGYYRTSLDAIPRDIAVDRFARIGDFIPVL